MGSKRKRNGDYWDEPPPSDSDDANFDPTEHKKSPPARRSKPKSKSKAPARKKRARYAGSGVEDDDDVMMDSDQDDSFDDHRRDDDGDSDDAPVNPNTGRAMRKAATKSTNYKESSAEEEESEARQSAEERPKPTRLVKIKVAGKAKRAEEPKTPAVRPPSRRTRANTEEAELLVLSSSGKHGVPLAKRGSRDNSPDSLQTTRPTRGSKGLKQPVSTIDEATQESDSRIPQPEVEEAEQDFVPAEEDEAAVPAAEEGEEAEVVEEAADGQVEPDAGVVGDDEDDDEPVAALRGRATRQSRLHDKPKKSMQEPSSDFEPEPVEEDSGDGEMSASDAKSKKTRAISHEDEEYSSQHSRGRRGAPRGRKKRTRHESEDEDEVDEDEIAQEIEELRASSHSRSRRKRRNLTPEIAYEPMTRRNRKAVSYVPPPLDQLMQGHEQADPAPSPARRKRAGGGTARERPFASTYGPFGGRVAHVALLSGTWGSGAADDLDSDSSDDEGPEDPTYEDKIRSLATALRSANPEHAAIKEPKQVDLGKIKTSKELSDADPIGVDPEVDFNSVGGLQGHIEALQDMLTVPMLYPENYKRFGTVPPRGVLFHGPPGTGKTLLARALSNALNRTNEGKTIHKVSFYMRKGADALSKWVGEAERQLRLLFEEARRNQPSIIFFDEIDGLAPVRSSKQEQIHASIVSTLLALMDGMDGRGQVIVIGATNRPDNIDPALRRPGRFDREFYFPLPDIEARRSILNIHTKTWGLPEEFMQNLAKGTKGYGGADLRALCTEAGINCMKRVFPQIYQSQQKLDIDVTKLEVHSTDFMIAMKNMIPSSARSGPSNALMLPKLIEPLLRHQLKIVLQRLEDIFPRKKNITALEEAMFEPYNDADHGFAREELCQAFERSRIFRPRMLITGNAGMGQQYLSRAVLHHFEGVHVETFDLPSLLSEGSATVEQVIAQRFTEAKRHKPVVLYCPSIDTWKTTLSDSAWATFRALLTSIPATDAVLLLATTDCEKSKVAPEIVKDFFPYSLKNFVKVDHPDRPSRLEFFTNVISYVRKSPTEFPDAAQRKQRVLPVLPLAPLPPPAKPSKTKAELRTEKKMDRIVLNHLKIYLQPVMDQLKKKYKKFYNPIIPDTAIKYLFQEADPTFIRPDIAEEGQRPFEIAKDKYGQDCLLETATGNLYYNLDLTIIEERLSNGYYARPKDFTRDISTLAKDAKKSGDRERHIKASEMMANVWIDTADCEARFHMINFEEVYQRQMERYKEAREQEAKLKATRNIVDLIQSDVQQQDSEPAPGTTGARFRLMSPDPNHISNGAEGASSHMSNGEVPGSSSGRRSSDIQMGGVEEDVTQPLSQMGPPSQWPRMDVPKSGDVSARATAGNTQISQVSAVTTIPPGMSPSAIINDASTTKTSDPSTNRASGHWSTQATNGVHDDAGEGSEIPDTQPQGDSGLSQGPSQSTSNESQWAHSQAHGLARGILQPPHLGFGGDGTSSPTSSDSANARAAKSAVGSLANVLNEEDVLPRISSGSSASSSQPPVIIAEANVDRFLHDLGERTSGCTVDQLEQINRELMAELWHTRHEYNRTKVLTQVVNRFNESIRDMEEMQNFAPASQFEGQAGQED